MLDSEFYHLPVKVGVFEPHIQSSVISFFYCIFLNKISLAEHLPVRVGAFS